MTSPEALTETPDAFGAFPKLSGEHLALLDRYGERRGTEPGEVLIREGERDRDFYVILAGTVAAVEGYRTTQERVIGVHGPGRFLDGLSLLTRQPALLTSVVREAGEVLAVPLSNLRDAVSIDPRLGDVILRAYLIRRELLIGQVSGIRIIGSRFSPGTSRLREFAARNRLPHTWIDLEEDHAAEELLRQLSVTPAETPVVVCRHDQVLRNPTNAELAHALGVPVPGTPSRLVDLVVVGAGPAGLAAAVYGASEGLATVVLEAVATGGQAGTSARIENYLGFPAGISGAELADRAVIQAEKFGATISVPIEVTGLGEREGLHVLRLDDGSEIQTRAVIIATGARYRKLDVPRLAEFEGTSIYYAATLMEARFCRQQQVAVLGAGNSAGQAAVYLANHASTVRLLIRHDDLCRDMSRYLVDQIKRLRNVQVLGHTEVRELVGEDGELEALVVEDTQTGSRRNVPAKLLFVFIGALPCTGWLRDCVELDDRGYVRTGPVAGGNDGWPDQLWPQLLQTSRPGVLAVGDVRSASVKRLASAVGEGAMAVRLVHEYLARSGLLSSR